MSATIWLEIQGHPMPTEGDPYPERTAHRIEDAYWNLTYNLTPMLREAGMPAWSDLVGMKAGDAACHWRSTWNELRRHPDKYKAMNPVNGWGDYDGALRVLESMWRTCQQVPQADVGGHL